MRKQHSNLNRQKQIYCKRNPGGQRAARAKDIKKSKNSTRPSALISAEQKRGSLQVFCFEVHDFTVVDLFTVTNVSSTIGGLSRLVIRSAHSGGIEGSISNIIVS